MNTRLISTRGRDMVLIDEAIQSGLARDGGLYVPQQFPSYDIQSFAQDKHLSDFATRLLAPFFIDSLITVDSDFCKKVFSFPMPLVPLDHKSYALELFHGPTLSFKDFGARFFGQCLESLTQEQKTTVLVATSGDTGSAVASALHGKKNIRGIILFPKDKVSLRQQAQITCWRDNIHAVAVNGSFDQCQQLIKSAFLKQKGALTTANSINIARLLPQVIFYAYSSMQIAKKHQQSANFIVPSGNLGNVTACYWAKTLGFPIEQILIANNANTVLTDFLATGIYKAQPSLKTLANAMDVGDPSNIERLIHLFPDFNEFKKQMNVESVSDEAIQSAITDAYRKYNYLLCPHTATAYHRLKSVDKDKPWVIMATAHPAKFNEIIEPLLHKAIPVPNALQNILLRDNHFSVIEPLEAALEDIMNGTKSHL